MLAIKIQCRSALAKKKKHEVVPLQCFNGKEKLKPEKADQKKEGKVTVWSFTIKFERC